MVISKTDYPTGGDAVKKEKPAAVKKIKKDYAKPRLTRHKKLTLVTGGVWVRQLKLHKVLTTGIRGIRFTGSSLLNGGYFYFLISET